MNNIFSLMTSSKLPFKLLIVLIVILFLGLSEIVYAEEITYNGDGENLRETPPYFYKYSSGLQFPSSLFPGTTSFPLSSGNKVTVNYNPEDSEAINPKFVFGGLSETVKVANNSVTVRIGHVDDVFGGFSHRGDVADNVVTINGGFIVRNVYGGESAVKSAASNTVTINGGSVDGDIYGGQSKDSDAMDNTVTIKGGFVGEGVTGGMGGNNATHNTVVISGGSIGESVLGGSSGRGDVAENTTTISGGSVGMFVAGGMSSGNVTHNTVIFSGGSVGEGVAGGMGGNNVTHNTVIFSGGFVGEGVIGGYSENGAATDNTVTIGGSKLNLAKVNIWGGLTGSVSADVFTGNTLNCKSSGISAKSVGNFEYYNFYLPKNLATGAVMLSVAEKADLKGTIVNVSLQGGIRLKKGDKVALIRSSAGTSNAPKNKNCEAQHGGVLYEFSIYTDSNNLWAEVTNIGSPAK